MSRLQHNWVEETLLDFQNRPISHLGYCPVSSMPFLTPYCSSGARNFSCLGFLQSNSSGGYGCSQVYVQLEKLNMVSCLQSWSSLTVLNPQEVCSFHIQGLLYIMHYNKISMRWYWIVQPRKNFVSEDHLQCNAAGSSLNKMGCSGFHSFLEHLDQI